MCSVESRLLTSTRLMNWTRDIGTPAIAPSDAMIITTFMVIQVMVMVVNRMSSVDYMFIMIYLVLLIPTRTNVVRLV